MTNIVSLPQRPAEELAYYILSADKSLSVGDVIPNVAEDGRSNAAYADPRTVQISDALAGRANDCLVDIVRDGDQSPVRVARVSPRGAVQVPEAWHDEADTEDNYTPLEADGGWTVEAFEPLTVVLGPQAEQVIAAVREGFRVLDEEEDPAAAEAYIAASNHQHDTTSSSSRIGSSTLALWQSAEAAQEALYQRGADGWWWGNTIGCCWGNEILALAARDLIGTTPEWTQQAYDVLTRPWRTALSLPLHPEDPAVSS